MDGETPPLSTLSECQVWQNYNFFLKVRGVYSQASLLCGLPYWEVLLETASSIEGSGHTQNAVATGKGFRTNAANCKKKV